MKKLLIAATILLLLFLPHLFFSYRDYNVLLITIDTLRADYLSCYSSTAPATPNIDRIAHEGVLFTNAYSLIPITFPSHTAILTSHAPFEWHVFNNGDVFNTKILENHSPLLTDDMRKAGYETGAFVSLAILKSNFGLNHGFQTYQDDFGRIRWYRVASEMNDSAIPWIEKQSKNHFFAWIHYSDPHEPYITVDAPPDTEVSINGDEPNRFCIAKKELNFFHFEANPGKNVIHLRTVDSNSPHLI